MRVAIIGDSFVETYKNSWVETVCTELNLEVVYHVGYGGHSQYKVYKSFLKALSFNTDLICYVFPDYSRLYNENYAINWHSVNMGHIKNSDVLIASKSYYEQLYSDDFARTVDKLLINYVQEQCKKRNIKLVNIPAMSHNHVEKNYGLWITVEGGLFELCVLDFQKTEGKNLFKVNFKDNRINHFSPNGHQIIAQAIIPLIKSYIQSDQEFQNNILSLELFA